MIEQTFLISVDVIRRECQRPWIDASKKDYVPDSDLWLQSLWLVIRRRFGRIKVSENHLVDGFADELAFIFPSIDSNPFTMIQTQELGNCLLADELAFIFPSIDSNPFTMIQTQELG